MRPPSLIFSTTRQITPTFCLDPISRRCAQKLTKNLMCVHKETKGVNNGTVMTVNVNPV